NDLPGQIDRRNTRAIDGGTVSMTSTTGVRLDAGSLVDVSGGAWVDYKGNVTPGAAGAISVATNRDVGIGIPASGNLDLNGTLAAYGIEHGGSLTLIAGNLIIGSGNGGLGTFVRGGDFLSQGGFTSFQLTGIDGVLINTTVAPVAQNYELPISFRSMPNAPSL